jgi:hypothetical protein
LAFKWPRDGAAFEFFLPRPAMTLSLGRAWHGTIKKARVCKLS